MSKSDSISNESSVMKLIIPPKKPDMPSYMVYRGPSIFTNRKGKSDIVISAGYPPSHEKALEKGGSLGSDGRRYSALARFAAEDLNILRSYELVPAFLNEKWLADNGFISRHGSERGSVASRQLSDIEVVDRLRDLGMVNTYIYHVNKDERGEFSSDLRDILTDETVWECSSLKYMNEMLEDGYMRHSRDIEGLCSHMTDMGVAMLPAGSTIHAEGDESGLIDNAITKAGQAEYTYLVDRYRSIISRLREQGFDSSVSLDDGILDQGIEVMRKESSANANDDRDRSSTMRAE